MRYLLGTSAEDIAGDILAGSKMLAETYKGAKFRRSSRVCRRTFRPRNGLHKIPENDTVDFRRLVCASQAHIDVISPFKARVAPPGQVKTTGEASPKEEIRKKLSGFWKVFKMKQGTETKRKTNYNHNVEAASMLSFI